ncbi:hypothetical protein N5O88_05490 [Pseudomonas sp. GD03721]|nr:MULTISPECIES: hypothetical protein [unclassified Pseudomonas]MDH1442058.1 hypothetical protein [Pseudomonas sp. GD03722]WGG02698.1 hypothetical protein N5O88_05490 [Pseudomonas sp. GD03721]WGG06866.1 hypothetical protein N5O87_05500 [Pseudomonas sp. GD03919]
MRNILAAVLVVLAPAAWADDVEYLLPPDWEATDAAPVAKTLGVTRQEFSARFVAAAREVPQCAKMVLSGDHPLMRSVKLGLVDADVLFKGDGQLESVKFVAAGSPKDDASLSLMMCSSYATIRATQPDIFDVQAALSQSSNVWARAKSAPAVTATGFYFIASQLIPFQFELRPTK